LGFVAGEGGKVTKEEIAAIRAKLENPAYLKKACDSVAGRIADGWQKIGYPAPPMKVSKQQKRNWTEFYAEAPFLTVNELAEKYKMRKPTVRTYLIKKGVTPADWCYVQAVRRTREE
jgi:hypothetical protein